MGTPQAAVPSLKRCLTDGHEIAAVYTQPDRASGRGNRVVYSPVKEFALANGIPVYQPTKIKTAEAAEIFSSHRADAAVVVAYGRILPDGFLTAFQHGAINVHFSLLPRYRGAAPVNWAIVRGESVTGVTTMQMDQGLDTGDILLQRSMPIAENETAAELMPRLAQLGADLLSETLTNLARLTPIPQEHDCATLAPIMKRDDGLIDWHRTASEIRDRIRGFQPFPASFSYLDGAKVTIWSASLVENIAGKTAVPGKIIKAHGDDLLVMCGGNSIINIKEIQLEGKRRMTTRDFINGLHQKESRQLESFNDDRN